MSQPPRPIYTKSRKTKRPRQHSTGSGSSFASRTPTRFHGAFTGGHSAGYWDTVGSRDGWRPEEDLGTDDFGRKRQQRVWENERTAADYMDDRDHDEWAGPSGIKSGYIGSAKQMFSREKEPKLEKGDERNVLLPSELIKPPDSWNASIGKRLLRKLGWRERSNGDQMSSAYVPSQEIRKNDDPTQTFHDAILSKKLLKKIQLSEKGRSLPLQKTDTFGLGFKPFKNAPEFAAHHEMLRQRAKKRARSAESGHGRYRTSDLFEDEDSEGVDGGRVRPSVKSMSRHRDFKVDRETSSDALAFETTEDFIGTKTAAGFALSDDADDVYDLSEARTAPFQDSTVVGIGGEKYNTEVIDHGSSDSEDDENGLTLRKKISDHAFAGALSTWTSIDIGSDGGLASESLLSTKTSGDHPTLQGFVLCSEKLETNKKHWPGPDLPVNFEPSRHLFKEEDLQQSVARMSRNARVEVQDSRTKAKSVTPNGENKPMAGVAFTKLADAMKERFTPGAGKADLEKEQAGLIDLRRHVHAPSGSNNTAKDILAHTTEEVKAVKRTIMLWTPESLLCKRLGVRPPFRPSGTQRSERDKVNRTQSEEMYQNILGATAMSTSATAKDSTDQKSEFGAEYIQLNDKEDSKFGETYHQFQETEGGELGICRPPKSLLESIFGGVTEVSSVDESSSEMEDDHGTPASIALEMGTQEVPANALHKSSKTKVTEDRKRQRSRPVETVSSVASSPSSSGGRQAYKKHKKEKKNERKTSERRRRRSSSSRDHHRKGRKKESRGRDSRRNECTTLRRHDEDKRGPDRSSEGDRERPRKKGKRKNERRSRSI